MGGCTGAERRTMALLWLILTEPLLAGLLLAAIVLFTAWLWLLDR